MRAVARLLLLTKQHAALPQHAWSMKLSPAPVSPQYLRSLRGPGRSICTPRCVASSYVLSDGWSKTWLFRISFIAAQHILQPLRSLRSPEQRYHLGVWRDDLQG